MEEKRCGGERAQVYIGTAGYSYADWVGAYYPAGLPAGEMLPFYAREFLFTEINSSFYRLPNKFMLAQLAKKTPPEFVFAVKAYRSLTHDRGAGVAADCRSFREAVHMLGEAGKLGPVLLQFPYSFTNTTGNCQYLVRVREWLRPLNVVVEFRHQSWVRDETWALLRAEDMGYACVDEPRLKGLIAPGVICTAATAYVRFHGRNAAKWWRHHEAYERYNYLYSDEELRSWLPGLARLKAEARVLFVVFNNHFQGQAVQNARMLRQLLGA